MGCFVTGESKGARIGLYSKFQKHIHDGPAPRHDPSFEIGAVSSTFELPRFEMPLSKWGFSKRGISKRGLQRTLAIITKKYIPYMWIFFFPAKICLTPCSSEFFSTQKIDDKVCRWIKANKKMRQIDTECYEWICFAICNTVTVHNFIQIRNHLERLTYDKQNRNCHQQYP